MVIAYKESAAILAKNQTTVFSIKLLELKSLKFFPIMDNNEINSDSDISPEE